MHRVILFAWWQRVEHTSTWSAVAAQTCGAKTLVDMRTPTASIEEEPKSEDAEMDHNMEGAQQNNEQVKNTKENEETKRPFESTEESSVRPGESKQRRLGAHDPI